MCIFLFLDLYTFTFVSWVILIYLKFWLLFFTIFLLLFLNLVNCWFYLSNNKIIEVDKIKSWFVWAGVDNICKITKNWLHNIESFICFITVHISTTIIHPIYWRQIVYIHCYCVCSKRCNVRMVPTMLYLVGTSMLIRLRSRDISFAIHLSIDTPLSCLYLVRILTFHIRNGLVKLKYLLNNKI